MEGERKVTRNTARRHASEDEAGDGSGVRSGLKTVVAEEGRAVLACGTGDRGQLGNGTYAHQRLPTHESGPAEVCWQVRAS